MSSRQEELSELRSYIKGVDKDVTMILQSLQWDRKHLLQCKPKSVCKYDLNHKVPPEKLKEHEEKCVLKCQGYAPDDVFLPDVLDPNSNTVLKFSSENINDIINYALKTDPLFKKGDGNATSAPLTLERLQATYTPDERRAIYDVTICRPSCDELSDLALGQIAGASQAQSKQKSKLEQLAELRDLRRRRTKYRVAVCSSNYSHTLRALIDTQMEMFTEAQGLSKSHYKPDSKYPTRKEQLVNKSLDNSSDKNITEHRDFAKERSGYDRERRNNCSENKRKRAYDDEREKNRHRDRETYDRNRRQERTRDSYRQEKYVKYDSHQNFERNTKYIKEERDRSRSIDSPRHRECEREDRYNKDKDRSYNKEVRDKYSSSSRESQRYRGSEREERYRRDGKYMKDKSDRNSSSLRDSQRYHHDEILEQHYKYKDIKEERESSSPRDIQRYRRSEREERNSNVVNRVYIKEERNSSSPKDI